MWPHTGDCFMNTSPFTGQNRLQCNQVIIMDNGDSHFSLKQLAIREKRAFLFSDIFQAWADACLHLNVIPDLGSVSQI